MDLKTGGPLGFVGVAQTFGMLQQRLKNKFYFNVSFNIINVCRASAPHLKFQVSSATDRDVAKKKHDLKRECTFLLYKWLKSSIEVCTDIVTNFTFEEPLENRRMLV